MRLKWSPGGDRLAAAINGTISVWDFNHPAPRFSRQVSSSPITDLSWSGDGALLACTTTDGSVILRNAPTLTHFLQTKASRDPLRCISWAPSEQRVAFAGDDRILYLMNCESDSSLGNLQRGFGHQSSIRTVTWDTKGESLATGSESGLIGLWFANEFREYSRFNPRSSESRQSLNELRHFLQGVQGWRQGGSIADLAWTSERQRIACVSVHGEICVWDAESRRLLRASECGEPAVGIAFSPDGNFLVVRTADSIRFIYCLDSLSEIARVQCQSHQDGSCLALHNASARLATPDGGEAIRVWEVDFPGLLRHALTRRRTYSNAKVVLLGSRNVGKSSIASALMKQEVHLGAQKHGLSVHKLLCPELYRQSDGTSHVQDILVWDLPNDSAFDSVERLLLSGSNTVLLVFDSRADQEELLRLRELEVQARPMDQSADQNPPWKRIFVASRSDGVGVIDRRYLADSLTKIFHLNSPPAVYFVSALGCEGIEELDSAIRRSLEGMQLLEIASPRALEDITAFIERQRSAGRLLTTRKHLHSLFAATQPSSDVSEDKFKTCIELLQNHGLLYSFAWGDQLLLQPDRCYRYAAAMTSSARQDKKGMGRLRMTDALSAAALKLDWTDRIQDLKQEEVLLQSVVSELVVKGLAATVSTNDGLFLTFPTQLTRAMPPVAEPQVGQVEFGGGRTVYSSLLVRMLGLAQFYPDSELYDKGAIFRTASGGKVGMTIHIDPDMDAGRIAAFFDASASEADRDAFLQLLNDHLQSMARRGSVKWTQQESRTAGPISDSLTVGAVPLPVLFCYDPDNPDVVRNVEMIANDLKGRQMVPWLITWVKAGQNRKKQMEEAMRHHRIAVVLIGKGGLNKSVQMEVSALKRLGLFIIPVLLPGASSVPGSLQEHHPVDFRKEIGREPFERLVEGIVLARDSPTEIKALRPDGDKKHVFLSFCREDAKAADERLHLKLMGEGMPVWAEKRILAGAKWQETIRKAITEAFAVVVCFSPNVSARIQSQMFDELEQAINIQTALPPDSLFLIPVLLEPCSLPVKKVGSSWLSELSSIDLSNNEPAAFAQLLEALMEARNRWER